VQADTLMSYGPASLENHAGAAHVDRILKGARIQGADRIQTRRQPAHGAGHEIEDSAESARPRRRGGRVMVCVRSVKGLR
jgi:hypothetical protein